MVNAELMANIQGKGFNSPNPPVLKIIASNKRRSPAIDTIAKTKIKGPDMFGLVVEQYLVQELDEETPDRAVSVDVKTILAIMCATRMSDGEPGEDFIRLSTVLGGDEGRTFHTLLDSVRLHCAALFLKTS
jgi:hypothetical protein